MPIKINGKFYIKINKAVVLPKFDIAKSNESKSKNLKKDIALISMINNMWHATFNVKFVYEYEEIDETTAIALAMHLKSATKDRLKKKTI